MTLDAAGSLADLASDGERESYDAKTVPIWQVRPWTPEATAGIGPAAQVRCALWGCERHVFAHGLCAADFKFWKRNGTEALNRRRKRIPETREEARALMQVRAIELADAEVGTPEYEQAERELDEAARFFGDPAYREKYDRRRNALAQAIRRRVNPTLKVVGPFKNTKGETTKQRIIREQGIDGWRKYRAQVDANAKANFIAKYGEAKWKARQAQYARDYQARKRAAKKAKCEGATITQREEVASCG